LSSDLTGFAEVRAKERVPEGDVNLRVGGVVEGWEFGSWWKGCPFVHGGVNAVADIVAVRSAMLEDSLSNLAGWLEGFHG
jgi:hypothetical protein